MRDRTVDPSKRTLKIVGASLLVLALAWQHVQATRLGYEVERSRRQVQMLKGKIGFLRMEIETSLSPAQLALHAKSRLGMFPASPESLRILTAKAAGQEKETFLSRLFPKSWRIPLHT